MQRENPKGTLKFWPHTLCLIPCLMLLRRAPENFRIRFKLAASGSGFEIREGWHGNTQFRHRANPLPSFSL